MIYLGSDHRGFELKEKVKQWLDEWNLEFVDLGNDHLDPEDDYPVFATLVAKRVKDPPSSLDSARDFGEAGQESKRAGEKVFGILICGSGVGVDIVANRYQGVRCGLGFSVEQIKKAREDDDINCLALAADFLDEAVAKEIVDTFLNTEFSKEEKKRRRIEKIENCN